MAIEGLEAYRVQFEAEARAAFAKLMREQKQQVGLALWEQVDRRTPVDEGEARKGWHFSSPRASGVDRAPSDALGELANLTNAAAPEDPVYLQNNVPHAVVLDDGTFVPPNPGPSKDPRPGRKGRILVVNGYSSQAPTGISDDALDIVATQFGLPRSSSGT